MMKNLVYLFLLILFACSNTPVLTEGSFGGMLLEKYTKASLLDQLNLYFPEEKIKVSQAAQDGPSYTKIEFGSIGHFKFEKDLLREFFIQDSSILDQYHAHVGMTLVELLKIRPELEIEKDYHHVYARQQGSKIYYQLRGGPDNKPQSSFSRQEIEQMTIFLIIWNPE